jgi:hypothetical protein
MKRQQKNRKGSVALEYVLSFAMMVAVLAALFWFARGVVGHFFDFGSMAARRPWL